jgi:hypothetical protein
VQPLIDHSPLANVVFRVEGVVLPVLTYQISGNGVAVPDDEIIIHENRNGVLGVELQTSSINCEKGESGPTSSISGVRKASLSTSSMSSSRPMALATIRTALQGGLACIKYSLGAMV